MKTIKLTLALLAFMIGISSCASIIGSSKDIMMSVQKGMTQKEVSSILGNRNIAVLTKKQSSGSM